MGTRREATERRRRARGQECSRLVPILMPRIEEQNVAPAREERNLEERKEAAGKKRDN